MHTSLMIISHECLKVGHHSSCPAASQGYGNAHTDGPILIYAAWDLEIVEVIHAYVTHDH